MKVSRLSKEEVARYLIEGENVWKTNQVFSLTDIIGGVPYISVFKYNTQTKTFYKIDLKKFQDIVFDANDNWYLDPLE